MNPEIISAKTNLDLWQAFREYRAVVHEPKYRKSGVFVVAYSDVVAPLTLILTSDTASIPDSIAIMFTNTTDNKSTLVNIDIYPEAPAQFVLPGFFLLDGSRCYSDTPDSQFMRKPLRCLSESEGQALISDMHQIVTETASL